MTYRANQSGSASAGRHISIFAAVSFAALAGLAQTASAADVEGQAVFQGLILDTCTVNVLNPGVLGASGDQTRLASDEVGGVPANALVVTNSDRSSVQVLPPVAFETAPVGSDLNTTFGTSYTLAGTTTGSAEDGQTLTSLNLGATDMIINAEAQKAEGNYNGGQYSFVTTVRCVTP